MNELPKLRQSHFPCLPRAIDKLDDLEAREQLSWAAHNALANGGVPNGHAIALAIACFHHMAHGHSCALALPATIRHFAETSPKAIINLAKIMNVETGDNARENADRLANAFARWRRSLGLSSVRELMLKNGVMVDEKTFTAKIIPATLDDFKSRLWNPPIHNNKEEIARICHEIYNEA